MMSSAEIEKAIRLQAKTIITACQSDLRGYLSKAGVALPEKIEILADPLEQKFEPNVQAIYNVYVFLEGVKALTQAATPDISTLVGMAKNFISGTPPTPGSSSDLELSLFRLGELSFLAFDKQEDPATSLFCPMHHNKPPGLTGPSDITPASFKLWRRLHDALTEALLTRLDPNNDLGAFDISSMIPDNLLLRPFNLTSVLGKFMKQDFITRLLMIHTQLCALIKTHLDHPEVLGIDFSYARVLRPNAEALKADLTQQLLVLREKPFLDFPFSTADELAKDAGAWATIAAGLDARYVAWHQNHLEHKALALSNEAHCESMNSDYVRDFTVESLIVPKNEKKTEYEWDLNKLPIIPLFPLPASAKSAKLSLFKPVSDVKEVALDLEQRDTNLKELLQQLQYQLSIRQALHYYLTSCEAVESPQQYNLSPHSATDLAKDAEYLKEMSDELQAVIDFMRSRLTGAALLSPAVLNSSPHFAALANVQEPHLINAMVLTLLGAKARFDILSNHVEGLQNSGNKQKLVDKLAANQARLDTGIPVELETLATQKAAFSAELRALNEAEQQLQATLAARRLAVDEKLGAYGLTKESLANETIDAKLEQDQRTLAIYKALELNPNTFQPHKYIPYHEDVYGKNLLDLTQALEWGPNEVKAHDPAHLQKLYGNANLLTYRPKELLNGAMTIYRRAIVHAGSVSRAAEKNSAARLFFKAIVDRFNRNALEIERRNELKQLIALEALADNALQDFIANNSARKATTEQEMLQAIQATQLLEQETQRLLADNPQISRNIELIALTQAANTIVESMQADLSTLLREVELSKVEIANLPSVSDYQAQLVGWQQRFQEIVHRQKSLTPSMIAIPTIRENVHLLHEIKFPEFKNAIKEACQKQHERGLHLLCETVEKITEIEWKFEVTGATHDAWQLITTIPPDLQPLFAASTTCNVVALRLKLEAKIQEMATAYQRLVNPQLPYLNQSADQAYLTPLLSKAKALRDNLLAMENRLAQTKTFMGHVHECWHQFEKEAHFDEYVVGVAWLLNLVVTVLQHLWFNLLFNDLTPLEKQKVELEQFEQQGKAYITLEKSPIEFEQAVASHAEIALLHRWNETYVENFTPHPVGLLANTIFHQRSHFAKDGGESPYMSSEALESPRTPPI